jgi:DNA-binding response OmpR family regulator
MPRNTDEASLKILVANDDRLSRSVVVEALTNDGFSVVDATNASALEVFREHAPGLVVIDLDTSTSALEVCRRIREESSAAVPILALIGSEHTDQVRAALEAGAADFVDKPVRWTMLGERVRRLLGGRTQVSNARDEQATQSLAQRIAGLGSWKWNAATKEMRWSEVTY